jgi:hypothetical protein
VKMTVKMAILTLATVAFQFGLAVLGWGGFAAFFSHPPLVAVAIVCFSPPAAHCAYGPSLFSGALNR